MVIVAASRIAFGDATFATHAPMHPLPSPSTRALAKGPTRQVDPRRGDDAADGTTKPWRTLAHAVAAAKPGETIVLHGGVYFETVTIATTGLTIRSAPGELAIIDGGLREFEETPSTAWQPVNGGPDEYQSTATYSIDKDSEEGRGVWVTGNFADSMIPLHGYRYESDFRATNEHWTVNEQSSAGGSIYVGPGVWFDWYEHKIHVRLSHTHLKSSELANYTGETDPTKLGLVIGIDRVPLRIDHAKHIHIQDLVVRGAAKHTVDITDSDDIELDGVTVYGGSPAIYVQSTSHFRLVRSALRGLAAPWSSRASMKYRGNSPYLFAASSKAPQSHDWEMAYDEFTDSHDGLVIDSIKTLRFHHNRIDNFNDDGIYLTLPPRQVLPEDVEIYENYFTRVLTTLAFAQEPGKPNTVGSGVYIFRNVFDLRDGTYGWPAAADDKPPTIQPSNLCGDHGSPTWEPLFFYQNTVLTQRGAWRDYYGAVIGVMGVKGSRRRVFNNVFLHVDGDAGLVFDGTEQADLQVDGNLLWSVHFGPSTPGDYFDQFRHSKVFDASKRIYPPGWGAHDMYTDPKFVDLDHSDLRLRADSPAIDAGIVLPKDWPDVLRTRDRGKPDIGALPLGVDMLQVGAGAAKP